MNKIETLSIKRYSSYMELSFIMRFPLPAIWGTGQVPIAGLQKIIDSYGEGYALETLPSPDFTILSWRGTYNVELSQSLTNYKITLAIIWNARKAIIDAYTLLPGDQISSLAWSGSTWITI